MRDKLDVKTIALKRALQMLDALGARYKVIMPEGDEYGILAVATEPERVKKGSRYGYGSLREHYRPFVEGLRVGDDVVVPQDRFDLKSLQSGIAALAFELWGEKKIIVTQRHDLGGVQVMRVAE